MSHVNVEGELRDDLQRMNYSLPKMPPTPSLRVLQGVVLALNGARNEPVSLFYGGG